MGKKRKPLFSERGYTAEWLAWANAVNCNYHDGNMPMAKAERMAGAEPQKYLPFKITGTDVELADVDATYEDFLAQARGW